MIRAFTGPSRLTKRQANFVWRVVRKLGPADEVRSGAAFGTDTEAAIASLAHLPDARHVVFVPDAAHNPVADLLPGAEVIVCQAGARTGGPAEAYRVRNTEMVTGVHELVAFVRQPTFYRSGEWMTINIARRLGVPRIDTRILP